MKERKQDNFRSTTTRRRSRSRESESGSEQEDSGGEETNNENDSDDTTKPSNTRPASGTTPVTRSSTPSAFPTTTNNTTTSTINTSTTSATRTNTAGQTAVTTTSFTTTAMQRVETPAPTLAPTPGSSASNKVTITVLASVAGLVFIVVILLVLFLAWRKWCQTRPQTDVTPTDKSTYHMYSEIDHTTIILDEEPRGPSSQRVAAANDRAVPSAPVYEDIPDTLVNENAYDLLHQKELVDSKDTYSVLDPRLVDLNDPCLNTYDVASNIIGNSIKAENPSGTPEPVGQYFVLEPKGSQVEPPSRRTSDDINCNTNNSDPTDNDGQYFILEKLPEGRQ